MTTTTAALRVAGTDNIGPVTALIADAFGFLEVIGWLAPHPGHRWEMSRGWHQPEVNERIDGGAHSAATSCLSGTVERTA